MGCTESASLLMLLLGMLRRCFHPKGHKAKLAVVAKHPLGPTTFRCRVEERTDHELCALPHLVLQHARGAVDGNRCLVALEAHVMRQVLRRYFAGLVGLEVNREWWR